ncbi:molybdopterin-guanine dinucleotide biosynthesis protein B [Chloroflexota bacterium]
MIPIVSFIGYSNSGKTTMVVETVAELKKRGYRVAVLKHTGIDTNFDTENKDTWRFTQAGAEISAIASSGKMAVFKDIGPDFGPEEFAAMLPEGYDILITEGYKNSTFLKIEVHGPAQDNTLIGAPGKLLAVVSDGPLLTKAPLIKTHQRDQIANILEELIQPDRRTQNTNKSRMT